MHRAPGHNSLHTNSPMEHTPSQIRESTLGSVECKLPNSRPPHSDGEGSNIAGQIDELSNRQTSAKLYEGKAVSLQVVSSLHHRF